ncbi:hypothetical protein H0H81_011289 [Sphagnurus paluster]|uniref:Uncharacterized protein n=1 Tax=Sphagnurus paluster TaxID=117069 RepID=A0A9P7GN58_9AGAR|nr:hypothetical protein H0H81_011289 [Sphagnurus paluster]
MGRARADPSLHRLRAYRNTRLKQDTKQAPNPSRPLFNLDDETFFESDQEGPESAENNEERPLFYWEEESTLFSDLLDSPCVFFSQIARLSDRAYRDKEPKQHELNALVNSLQPSFDRRGRELKKEIAETLVPTVNRVKGLYRKIDTDVDRGIGKGIIFFNDACKELEALAIRDHDELKELRKIAQCNIEILFGQLAEAYKTREHLWIEFEKAMEAIVNPTIERLKALPSNIEHLITGLEKQARNLEKDDTNAAEKKIKGLLGKA